MQHTRRWALCIALIPLFDWACVQYKMPIEEYRDQLRQHAIGAMKVEACHMASLTTGYCTLQGTSDAIGGFMDGQQLERTTEGTPGDACLVLEQFGRRVSDGTYQPLPGFKRYKKRHSIFPDDDDYQIWAAYVSPSGEDACVALRIPIR